MVEVLWFLGTLAVSCIVGFLAHKAKIPMGAMLGAMVAATAFNLITDHGVFYNELRILLQLLTGAMIGSRIGIEEAKSMKTILVPTVMLLIGMVVLNIAFGAAVFYLSELDIVTSLFSVTPGGATDMAMISADLGANTAYVAILQILRIIIIITLLPPIFKAIVKKTHYREFGGTIVRTEEAKTAGREHEQRAASPDEEHPHDSLPVEPFRYNRRETILLAGLFVCAIAGGLLFRLLGVPAGAIIGAMLFGIAYSIVFGKAVYPKRMRPWQQVLAGAYIGVSIDKQTVASMDVLFIPLMIMIIGILVFVFLISLIIHKLSKLDFVTCLLACTPGGITEMSLLSEEFGADTPKIAVMQTVRLVLVIMIFPFMIQTILSMFG
ncbi:MAG: AbrB family transcriptional regulator [Oscillospiraceae bacterium]|nr:AbrB family transcriptional regulator [Oscillospiraceae bacterium]